MAASDVWDEKFAARWLKASIEVIIKDLDESHRKVNIARVAGSSVTFVTGGTAAGLAIAAPFTMGITLLPALILGIISCTGGIVSAGSSVVELHLENLNVKEVQEKWDDFRQKYLARHNREELRNINARENGGAERAADFLVTDAARGAGGIAGVVVVKGVKSTTTAVRVVSHLMAAASFLALPLGFADLVMAAHNLRKKTRSSATKPLVEIVKFLDTIINDGTSDEMDKENLKMKALQLHEKVQGIEKLRKLHIAFNISRVAGTVTSIAGGAFGVSTALVPLTFGAAAPIAFVVGLVAFALSSGASVAEFVIERTDYLSLEINCKVFFEFFVQIYSLSPQRKKEWLDWLDGKSMKKELSDCLTGKSVLKIYDMIRKVYKAATSIAEKVSDGVKMIFEVGEDIIKGLKVAGKVFAGLNIGGIVGDVVELVRIIFELHERKGSLASERFERYNVLFLLVIKDDEDKLLHAEMSTMPTTVSSLLSDDTTVD